MLHKGARLRNKRFFFPFCLFVIFVVVVVIVVLRFKASGAMFWERIRRKSRAGKKNETYALKWERFFYSRFTKTQVELPVYLTFASAWLQNVPAELRMQCAARRIKRTFTHGKWSVRLLHHVSSLSLKSFKTDSILPSADQANKILNYTLNESSLIALWRGHFFGRE